MGEARAVSVAAVSSRREAPSSAAATQPRRRRARARRSFIAVLCGLAAFSVLQLGLSVVVEISLPEIRDPIYGHRLHLVQNSLRAGPSKPWTVLMMGSSHVEWGFRVEKSQEKNWSEILGHPVATFNFGLAGSGVLTEVLTWDRLRRDGVRPSLLLIEVFPVLLSGRPGDYSEGFLPTHRVAWGDLPLIERYAGSDRKGLQRDWLESRSIGGYTHRLSLISLVGTDLLPPAYRLAREKANNLHLDESGAPGVPAFVTSEQRLSAMHNARIGYQPRLAAFHLNELQCQAVCELLASCRRERVPVAMVLMPEGPTFRSWYPPGTWEVVQERVTQISREYDAPLINAREWIDDEEDFMDSHHLLLSGRAKFTERLGREYILPLLRRYSDEGKPPGGLAVLPSQPR
jgi:hypothetical protein